MLENRSGVKLMSFPAGRPRSTAFLLISAFFMTSVCERRDEGLETRWWKVTAASLACFGFARYINWWSLVMELANDEEQQLLAVAHPQNIQNLKTLRRD